MVGKTIHYCNRCDYKSNRRPNVKRHFSKMHTNLTSSAVERSQQFPLQQPSQQSLPNIHVPISVHLFLDFSHQFYFILLINDLFHNSRHLFYSGQVRNKYTLFYFINKWFILHLFQFVLFR